MSNSIFKRKVRLYFLNNPNQSLEEIACFFNISKSTAGDYLTNKKNLNIAKSLNESNLFFLFNDITERQIKTQNDGLTVINSCDFNFEEKVYLKSFGLKIY